MAELNLITCIVQKGKADKVVKDAAKAGAEGATVFYARGTGIRQKLGFWGKIITSEKEVILIVTKKDETDAVFGPIVKSGKLDKLGKIIPKDAAMPESLREIARKFYLKKVETLKFIMSEYGSKIASFAVLIVFTAFISKWMAIYKFAYLLSCLGWFFSRFSLIVFSFVAITVWFSLKKNLWLDVGSNLFFIPLQILVTSSIAFKIMDSNFPIWNRLFGSFILPVISGIITSSSQIQ